MFKLVVYFFVSGLQITYEPFPTEEVCLKLLTKVQAEISLSFEDTGKKTPYISDCFYILPEKKGITS